MSFNSILYFYYKLVKGFFYKLVLLFITILNQSGSMVSHINCLHLALPLDSSSKAFTFLRSPFTPSKFWPFSRSSAYKVIYCDPPNLFFLTPSIYMPCHCSLPYHTSSLLYLIWIWMLSYFL